MASGDFNPALIVVDFQEDFCPPNGSLAVPDGRSIAPTVNHLLTLPFTFKLATRDWHPPSHVSFASNHSSSSSSSSSSPPSPPKPFTSTTTIHHPSDPSLGSYTTTLWPIHCVQDTPGAMLVPELDQAHLHEVLDKGIDERVEMYSAFYDPLHVSDSGLARRLKERGVTDVFVVGLAADFCVKATAEDAVAEGFRVFVVEEGTKPVMPGTWEENRAEMLRAGVKMVKAVGDEMAMVKALS